MICQIGRILFVSLILIQRTTKGIQCYQCNSLVDKECDDESVHGKYLQDCPETHNYCRKIISAYYFKEPEERFTLRECGHTGNGEEKCYRGKYSHDSYQYVCECKDAKGCNSSSLIRMKNSHLLTFQLILFLLPLKQLFI